MKAGRETDRLFLYLIKKLVNIDKVAGKGYFSFCHWLACGSCVMRVWNVGWRTIFFIKIKIMTKKDVKRTIRLNLIDNTFIDLNVCKVSFVKGDAGLLHFDKLETGVRLTYSQDIIDDFSKVKNIEIIREN